MSTESRPRATVFIATSLDGYIARPDGALDWLPTEADPDDPGEDHGYSTHIASVDALLMGRATFDVVLGFGGDWPYPLPVYVLTNHPDDLAAPEGADIRAVAGEPEQVMERLVEDGVGHVYVDGGDVIQQHLRAGTIDRLVLTTIPVLIGEGIPLFGPTGRDVGLVHVTTTSWPNGLVQRTYDVV